MSTSRVASGHNKVMFQGIYIGIWSIKSHCARNDMNVAAFSQVMFQEKIELKCVCLNHFKTAADIDLYRNWVIAGAGAND